jgi:hypothetical protein
LSDLILFDVVIVLAAAAFTAFQSYRSPRKRHPMVPEETRLSRALTDSYLLLLVVGLVLAGARIGDALQAPHLMPVAGALVAGLLGALTQAPVARLLASATRKK